MKLPDDGGSVLTAKAERRSQAPFTSRRQRHNMDVRSRSPQVDVNAGIRAKAEGSGALDFEPPAPGVTPVGALIRDCLGALPRLANDRRSVPRPE